MTAEVAQSAEEQQKAQGKKNFELLSVIVEKVTGTVKWFSVPRHYGFIQRDDNKEDVFVHRTAITASRSRFPTLKNGEPVEFSVVQTTGGVNAASVTGPNGQRVKGAPIFYRRPKPNPEGSDGQFRANGTAHASGDVEGTRQRGGPRRLRRGRRSFRPSQNGMGDGEVTGGSGEQDEEHGGASGAEGAGIPRQRPRRFRGGGRSRGRQRSTSTKQQTNGEANGEEGVVTSGEEGLRQQQPPRRGGRFRRGGGGGRFRRGGSGAPTRERTAGLEKPAVPENSEGSLEQKMDNMSLSETTNVSEKPKETIAGDTENVQEEPTTGDVSAEAAETTPATN
uniref:CSD_1 domain-containing protein n=1 Tax=Mesocestoides corti TaxID=53468 RepID=A0A5K3EGK8_MESCO